MITTSTTIHAQGLTKQYGDLTAVDHLDLEVRAGELFGFLGPNGAGKTSTIRMLCGVLQPTSGTAIVAGHDVANDPTEVKRRIGYMAERPYLYLRLTGAEFLRTMADLYGVDRRFTEERIPQLLENFQLTEKADEIIEGYSHGMRQKLALASTLIHGPQVLFLDEPTSGMDPRSARHTKDKLRELASQGRTIFLSTHVLDVAEQMCDRVAIVSRGRLVAVGTLDDLRAQVSADASLEDIFLQLTEEQEDAV